MIRTAKDVEDIFNSVSPKGMTEFGRALHRILKPYVDRVVMDTSGESVKPINIIAITDGAFTDAPGSVLHAAAKRLDNCNALPWRVGVQFFQIGDDENAARALEKLDDDAGKWRKEGIRDIVDTVPWKGGKLTAQGILKVVLGGVHQEYDKKQV